ncbi:MAG: ATP-binding protein [Methanolobus sp.]|nr:ATP-binding protein [Methanolobus sp.]
MRKDIIIVSLSTSFAILFWIADTYIVHTVFTASILPFSPVQQEFFHGVYLRFVVFVGLVLFGMTVSKMAQKCQSAEIELLSQLRFESIVAEISSHFIGKKSKDIDKGINFSLKKIAEFADADCSYLVIFSHDSFQKDTIYQWHSADVGYEGTDVYPGRDFPWWMDKLNSPDIVHIYDVSKLPPSAGKEKDSLENAGVMSVLSIPLQSNGQLIGAIGFDSIGRKKKWSPNYIKLMRIIGDIFLDSIERKKAEESVEKHRERLARAQAISHTGSWEVDLRTKKHFWSEEMYYLMGFLPDGISINRNTYMELIHPDDRALFNSCVRNALSIPGYKFDVKTRVIRKTGSICILHSLGEVTWDNEGKQLLFQGTTQDITDLSIAEEDLHRKNRNLLILQSTALIAASSMEMQDLLRDVLKEINSYVECDFGCIYLLSPKDNCFRLCSSNGINDHMKDKINNIPGDDPLFQTMPDMKSTWMAGTIDNLPGILNDFMSKEGIENIVYIPIVSREELVGIILLFSGQDTYISGADLEILGNVGHQVGITVENIRLLDETRKAYEELKSLDRMKDEFVANITHELKTPLISIKGYSEVIYEGLLGELDEKQKQCMKIIVSNSERLEHLIESLLNMNSLYFEKYHVFSPIHLKDVLDGAINSLSMRMEEKKISINKVYPQELSLVYGNCEFLKCLFVYVLDNSIKFSPQDSEILISIRQTERCLYVDISDHGIGIPENCMDRIFERFYQVDGSATRIYGGNGLGLYLAKNIAELHSGTIEVESEEGAGTVVHISVPLFNPKIHT